MPVPSTSVRRRPPASPAGPAVSFAGLVRAVLPQLGIRVPPGPASDAYTLHAEGEPDMYVMCAPGQEFMIAACVAGQLPQAPAADMLSRLLALNHPRSEFAAMVGLDIESGTVVVSSRHSLAEMRAASMSGAIAALRQQTRAVRQILIVTAGHT